MADNLEEEPLELTEDMQADESDVEEQDEERDEEDHLVLEGEEAAPASGEAESSTIRHLRAEIRERDKRLAELAKSEPRPQPIEIGEKPSLAGCEFDEERFEQELTAWNDRKAQAEQQARDAERVQRQQQEAWSQEVAAHEEKFNALPFRGKKEASEAAIAVLSEVQQAVIVKVADNSAQVIHALGTHPARLAEISKITDPLKLAAAVARLEGKLTVTKRGGPPEPERIARGSGSMVAKDKHLERLEKDADRTGDSSALIAYRAKLKAQAK